MAKSARGVEEDWSPVAIPRHLTLSTATPGYDIYQWLNRHAGRRNYFTRDDPRPTGSTWMFYFNGYGVPVVWFKDPKIAMLFKLTWLK